MLLHLWSETAESTAVEAEYDKGHLNTAMH